MALLLIFLSLVGGLAIGLWVVVSIPPAAYAYLTVVFLVALDGLLYSYHRLEHGDRIWVRLAQRISLQVGYGSFIIFFGANTNRDLLLLAVIPLGFNVFANFVQLVPRESGEIYWIPNTSQAMNEDYQRPAPRPVPVVEALPQARESEPEPVSATSSGTAVNVPTSPGSVTTITVSTSVPAEEPKTQNSDEAPLPDLPDAVIEPIRRQTKDAKPHLN